MSHLFDNAIQSIQLGVEDYQNDDPKRAVSAVRNFYAGVLLLAKEVLVRRVPKASPEEVIRSKYKPVPDGKGGIIYTPETSRTIDFETINKRFKDFDLPIEPLVLKHLSATFGTTLNITLATNRIRKFAMSLLRLFRLFQNFSG